MKSDLQWDNLLHYLLCRVQSTKLNFLPPYLLRLCYNCWIGHLTISFENHLVSSERSQSILWHSKLHPTRHVLRAVHVSGVALLHPNNNYLAPTWIFYWLVLQKEYPRPRFWLALLFCTNNQVGVVAPCALPDNVVE
jgi:hypothetical protein